MLRGAALLWICQQKVFSDFCQELLSAILNVMLTFSR